MVYVEPHVLGVLVEIIAVTPVVVQRVLGVVRFAQLIVLQLVLGDLAEQTVLAHAEVDVQLRHVGIIVQMLYVIHGVRVTAELIIAVFLVNLHVLGLAGELVQLVV